MRVKNRYTQEFKSEAINMAVNSDLSLSEVASNLGLNYKTLYNWVKGSMPESSSTQAGKSKIKELESELRALRRDLKRARQERDILKKAAAYFASQKS
jgi:transposase